MTNMEKDQTKQAEANMRDAIGSLRKVQKCFDLINPVIAAENFTEYDLNGAYRGITEALQKINGARIILLKTGQITF